MLKDALGQRSRASHMDSGKVFPARTVAKAQSGYTVLLEAPEGKEGLLVTNREIKIGSQVLVKVTGYQNGRPLLSAVFSL